MSLKRIPKTMGIVSPALATACVAPKTGFGFLVTTTFSLSPVDCELAVADLSG